MEQFETLDEAVETPGGQKCRTLSEAARENLEAVRNANLYSRQYNFPLNLRDNLRSPLTLDHRVALGRVILPLLKGF